MTLALFFFFTFFFFSFLIFSFLHSRKVSARICIYVFEAAPTVCQLSPATGAAPPAGFPRRPGHHRLFIDVVPSGRRCFYWCFVCRAPKIVAFIRILLFVEHIHREALRPLKRRPGVVCVNHRGKSKSCFIPCVQVSRRS